MERETTPNYSPWFSNGYIFEFIDKCVKKKIVKQNFYKNAEQHFKQTPNEYLSLNFYISNIYIKQFIKDFKRYVKPKYIKKYINLANNHFAFNIKHNVHKKLFLKFEKPSEEGNSFGINLGDSKKWMQFFFITPDKRLLCTTWKYYGMKHKAFEIDSWIGYYTPYVFDDFEIELNDMDVM